MKDTDLMVLALLVVSIVANMLLIGMMSDMATVAGKEPLVVGFNRTAYICAPIDPEALQ